MDKSRKRVFHELQKQALLKAVGECRRACITASSAAPIGGDVYNATHALVESIDDLAQILTGSREHFHLKPHKQHTAHAVPKRLVSGLPYPPKSWICSAFGLCHTVKSSTPATETGK